MYDLIRGAWLQGAASNMDAPLSLQDISTFSEEIRLDTYDYENSENKYLPGGGDLAFPAATVATAQLVSALQVLLLLLYSRYRS